MTGVSHGTNGLVGERLRDAVRSGAPGLVVLDVRSPGEFMTAHIAGSYNVPLDRLPAVAGQLSGLRSADGVTVALVCRSGVRAGQAEAVLRGAGLDSTRVLEGGIDGWERAGLPLERGRGAWSIERQVRAIAGGLVLAGVVGSVTVNRKLLFLSGFVGGGLLFAGVSDICMMGNLLMKLPFNRINRTDVADEVSRLLADRGQRL
jgi:rhodanese-related sulfurtransferase